MATDRDDIDGEETSILFCCLATVHAESYNIVTAVFVEQLGIQKISHNTNMTYQRTQ